ncbi:hypothetical protein GGX14DRAFT_610871 [Mycena pura]|uniref:Uncharacterized protein n=1 Tax=Mycena pura TaxID=153505 RepID=A0AAD6VK33_9AGAR|nr:hypothetical protein GGX14DRAFT_610871 [Mycena pura]
MATTFKADNTLGAFQIGILVSYMLFGITTSQAYVYYTRFPEDSTRLNLKALVAFVWPLCIQCSPFNYPGPLAASPAVHSAQPGSGRERWSTCNAIVQAYASQRLHDLLVHRPHPNGTAIGHGNIPQPLQRPYLPPMTIVRRYILHSSP